MFGDNEKAPNSDDAANLSRESEAKAPAKDQARSQGAYQFNDWAAI